MALLLTLPIYTGMMFGGFLLPTVRRRTLLMLFSQELVEPLADGNRALLVFITAGKAQRSTGVCKCILTYSEYLPPPSKHVVILLLHCQNHQRYAVHIFKSKRRERSCKYSV
ncbi:uncharacterized protein F5147DRAFT_694518 [Suillus discolor]|uniref:Uncharacterized protein n=1 Tax=Suillus discolor TaxID=1912936 RepID=A0A9P7F7Y6_9AGAM|nr:uncharacterized protein F5147DRAFT_694518 [Suillus discolor]KAG2108703.1 hypothetical protein F5147DRAFT_694518 [Suillus discolor]